MKPNKRIWRRSKPDLRARAWAKRWLIVKIVAGLVAWGLLLWGIIEFINYRIS